MKKHQYTNATTGEISHNAGQALKWHAAGYDVKILDRGPRGTIYATARTLHGARVVSRQDEFENECHDTCKRLAEEVNQYAEGCVYKCPECDETIIFPDGVGDKFKCPHCGEVNDADEYEQLSIYDYMDDVLDFEFTVTRYKEYRSCCVCIGWGGPNIYIDTADAYIKLYWGTTQTQYPITYDVRDKIDEWAEEYYDTI